MGKEIQAQKIKRIDEPEMNRKIILLFLEKLELLKPEERKEILRTIQLLNSPNFLIK